MSALDLKFDYVRNINDTGITSYNAFFVPANPEILSDLSGQVLPRFEMPKFTIGAQDTAQFIFASFAAAETFYYSEYAVQALAYINQQMLGPDFDSTRLVNTLGDDDAMTAAKGVASASIALAAGATNSINATITLKDDKGVTIAAVQNIEVYISEASTGIGLTGDSASGNLTASTGTILTALTAKKHIKALTDANGVLVLNLVDAAKPNDQRFVVVVPGTGRLVVSAASGTSWGA